MAEDSKGRIWAVSGNLCSASTRLIGHEWTSPWLSSAIILRIWRSTNRAALWINGSGRGVARFQLRNGSIAGFTTPRLSSNEVVFLRVDSRGWVWFGEDHGVELFDGQSWRRYTAGDGLIWDDCDAHGFLEDRTARSGSEPAAAYLISWCRPRGPCNPPPPPIFVQVGYGTKDVLNNGELALETRSTHRLAGVLDASQRRRPEVSLPPGGFGGRMGGNG